MARSSKGRSRGRFRLGSDAGGGFNHLPVYPFPRAPDKASGDVSSRWVLSGLLAVLGEPAASTAGWRLTRQLTPPVRQNRQAPLRSPSDDSRACSGSPL